MTSQNKYAMLYSQKQAKPVTKEEYDAAGMALALEMAALRKENNELRRAYEKENTLRMQLEAELQRVIEDRDTNWTRKRNKADIEKKKAIWMEHQLTGKKSDGRSIARAADSLQSYTQMCQMLDQLKSTGRMGIRNWAIFRVGICLGLRVSDLIRLKWSYLLTPEGQWRERIPVVEKKTSKMNLVLITDAVKETLDEYRERMPHWDKDGYVFTKSTGMPLEPKSASQIIVEANKVVKLTNQNGTPLQISSHTMRKTFANIILSCYDGSVEIEALEKARIALNHTSRASTEHYTSTLQNEVDNARRAVSDFVLGKTDIDQLGIPKMKTNNELYEAIEEMRQQISDMKEEA